MQQRPGIDALTGEQFDAVSSIWRRDGRVLSTCFSGTSMMPAIAPGQAVSVRCGVVPQVGDVVVCFVDRQPIVHRLVARSDTWLLTWGDANRWPDAPLAPTCCLGTIDGVPAARRAIGRTMLVWMLASQPVPIERLRGRVRWLHRLKRALAGGPVFALQRTASLLFKR